ncbi:MAG TPA: FlgD immunoglobulin-like domain containing protein [Capillimicrobium sp.]|nr:FlgD immunoglobulin-like domain containing protein [Capillimicrobium sp.]
MTAARARAIVFGLLVVATFAAFFIVQRIKKEPSGIKKVRITRLFSPNGDGSRDRAAIRFRVERRDTVSVRVIDREDEVVATLVDRERVSKGDRVRVTWDGRDDDGRIVADGVYRLRINLKRQGRAVLVRRGITVDTEPPRPAVASIGPSEAQPEILPLPGGGPAEIRFTTPSPEQPTEVLIYRTSPDVRLVGSETVPAGETELTWDGARDGRPLEPGTYVVALRTRDAAGNVGSTPAALPPRAPYGEGLPGHGGITIRRLGVQPTLEPTIAGTRARFGVDARQRPYRWAIYQVGVRKPVDRGRSRKPIVGVKAPDAKRSHLYVFEVRAGDDVTRVPFPVQSVATHRVLLVLPAILWQGRNPVDDDGDGWPNTLTGGLPVRRERVLADGLPAGFRSRIAPIVALLDRQQRPYDITTDLALAAGVGPRIENHSGVMLLGDTRWLPAEQQLALKRFVRDGGRVASFGVDSLRRQVRLTGEQILDPTAPARADAFGSVLAPLAHESGTTVTIFEDDVDLFAGGVYGGTGVFSGYDAYEVTESPGPDGEIVSSAALADGRKVIVAIRLGEGLVIRYGLPQLPERLDHRGNETQLVLRTWRLLAR